MLKFISRLQKKPEPERKRILIVSTVTLTLIIFAFWAASFRNMLTQGAKSNKTVETSPFTVLKDNLGSAYEGIMNSFDSSTTDPTASSTDTTITATTTNGQE